MVLTAAELEMSLHFSAAHSSRVTKKSQARNPLLKRSSSSPFPESPRRKPAQKSKSKLESRDELNEQLLDDHLTNVGLVKRLATDQELRNVAQTMKYIQGTMFDDIPERGGFNSTRISEILNLRKSLPPTVTVSHLHSLTSSFTSTEKEISALVRNGIVRKLHTPGRGTGGSNAGDSLVLTKDVESAIRGTATVDASLADKFLGDLAKHPTSQGIANRRFSAPDITILMRAGFLTFTSAIHNPPIFFVEPSSAAGATATSIANVSKSASGSLAAVGGENAMQDAGGGGGPPRTYTSTAPPFKVSTGLCELQLSLPGIGQYLKLLTSARSHLLMLLSKSPFSELPVYLLKERWEGGVSADDAAAKAKRYRREFAGVLPARTRKWKQFHGISFDWILAECSGAGLIEVFETGNVGQAARIP